VARIAREGEPHGLVISPDGKQAYVANRKANVVSVIDCKALKIVKDIPVGKRIDILTVTPDGRRLYVTSRDTNSVIVIDTLTDKIVAEIPTGKDPHGIAVLPASHH
jgi:YVTN family beta-propeller protein